jgi:stage II sporulation protein D
MPLRLRKKYLKLILIFFIPGILNLIFLTGCGKSSKMEMYSAGRNSARVKILGLLNPGIVKVTFNSPVEIDFNNEQEQNLLIKNYFQIEKKNNQCSILYNGKKRPFKKISIKTVNKNDFYDVFSISLEGGLIRKYRGGFEASNNDGEFNLIVVQKIDDLVASVLSSESNDDEEEYLKALAIIIRTYIIKNFNRHLSGGYDFCDNTHCQLFLGEDKKNINYIKAVKNTQNIILSFNNQPVDVFYCGSCGGSSILPQEVWKNYTAYYPYTVIKCDYCINSKYSNWKNSIPKESLLKLFSKDEKTSNISLNIEYDIDSIPQKVIIKVNGDVSAYSPDEFRILIGRAFKWNKILSNRFIVKEGIDPDKKETFIFSGRGFGHCVGFCQSGAEEMAKRKISYKNILAFYFPMALFSEIKY